MDDNDLKKLRRRLDQSAFRIDLDVLCNGGDDEPVIIYAEGAHEPALFFLAVLRSTEEVRVALTEEFTEILEGYGPEDVRHTWVRKIPGNPEEQEWTLEAGEPGKDLIFTYIARCGESGLPGPHVRVEPNVIQSTFEEWTKGVERRLESRLNEWTSSMLSRLLAHKDRGGPEGWERDEVRDLVARVKEESQDLFDSAADRDSHETRKQAANVANMAMMVADAVERLTASEVTNGDA